MNPYEERYNRVKAQLIHFVHIGVIDRWHVNGPAGARPSWTLVIPARGPEVHWTLDQVEAFVSGVTAGLLATERPRGWDADTETDRALEARGEE